MLYLSRFPIPHVPIPSSLGTDDDGLLFTTERHAQLPQQRQRLVVFRCAGHEREIETVHLVDLIVVDLRKDHLLLEADRIIAASIERARTEPAEVADARDRDRDEPVEELPHPRAAQRDAGADLLALPQAEVGDRLFRLRANGPLSADQLELLDDAVEQLGLLDGFAHAAVDHDLAELRDLVRVR